MFKRISNLFRGFFGLFVSGLERQNPEALLDVESENLRKQIGQYNQGLAMQGGLCERLKTQVRKNESEARDLRARTTANLKAGNREIAAQNAVTLQDKERDLEENKKQLDQAEATYKELVRARDVSIATAKQKIEALRSSISDMKMKTAMAELTEMASGMITTIGGSGDNLNRLSGMVEAEREKAAGRMRVARDNMDTTGLVMKEAEQKALGEQALADFAAREGIALDPLPGSLSSPISSSGAPQADRPVKQMGPAAAKE